MSAIKLCATWRADAYAIIHRSSSTAESPHPWRVTWLDADGPCGHTYRATRAEAVRAAVADGYTLLLSVRGAR